MSTPYSKVCQPALVEIKHVVISERFALKYGARCKNTLEL